MAREMIAPALLHGRTRYERVLEGWTDNSHPEAFTHTVRLRGGDPRGHRPVVGAPGGVGGGGGGGAAPPPAVAPPMGPPRRPRQVTKPPPERAARAAGGDP